MKSPTVFIFGAGATKGAFNSAPLPPPIDNEFFDIASRLQGHGTEKLVTRVLKSVWDLYGETRGISLEQYYRDLETREGISQFVKPPNQPMRWGKRRGDLEELIRRVYIHTTCDTKNESFQPKISSVHSKILKNLSDGDTVITFNYDLVIEEAFPKELSWKPTDGYGQRVHGSTRGWCKNWLEQRKKEGSKENSQIVFLKLHGSLNWRLYDNKQIRLKDRPFVVRRNRSGNPSVETIAILPPGWKKEGITKLPFSQFWSIAGNRLQNCKTVVILGYSLPETDLLAQALFAEVIRTRASRGNDGDLKELHLADPSETVKAKFAKMFSYVLGPSGKLFKYKDVEEFSKKV